MCTFYGTENNKTDQVPVNYVLDGFTYDFYTSDKFSDIIAHDSVGLESLPTSSDSEFLKFSSTCNKQEKRKRDFLSKETDLAFFQEKKFKNYEQIYSNHISFMLDILKLNKNFKNFQIQENYLPKNLVVYVNHFSKENPLFIHSLEDHEKDILLCDENIEKLHSLLISLDITALNENYYLEEEHIKRYTEFDPIIKVSVNYSIHNHKLQKDPFVYENRKVMIILNHYFSKFFKDDMKLVYKKINFFQLILQEIDIFSRECRYFPEIRTISTLIASNKLQDVTLFQIYIYLRLMNKIYKKSINLSKNELKTFYNLNICYSIIEVIFKQPFIKIRNFVSTKNMKNELIQILSMASPLFTCDMHRTLNKFLKNEEIERLSSFLLDQKNFLYKVFLIINICLYNYLNEKGVLMKITDEEHFQNLKTIFKTALNNFRFNLIYVNTVDLISCCKYIFYHINRDYERSYL